MKTDVFTSPVSTVLQTREGGGERDVVRDVERDDERKGESERRRDLDRPSERAWRGREIVRRRERD